MRRLLLPVILACFCLRVNAQKVENVRAVASGEQIVITYDLSGTKADQRFKVGLFSSHNNFSTPVQLVTGDVGTSVAPGKDKKITWNAKTELAGFKGSLSFEVRADFAGAPVATSESSQYKFAEVPSAKRGKELPIHWNGGSPSDNIKLDLVKENVPQQSVTTSKNTGSYTWQVPADLKPGTYQLKITGPSGTATSQDFAIKHKIPTLVKVLPVVVIAGVVAASGGGGGGGGGGPSGGGDLPTPATP